MKMKGAISETASAGKSVTEQQVASAVARLCPAASYKRKKVLLIVPDGTRTAPIGLVFQALHRELGSVTTAFDVLIALGTHQPMSDLAICERLGITSEQRSESYRQV